MDHEAAVVTVSDGVSSGTRVDESGDAAEKMLVAGGFPVTERVVVPDERDQIESVLTRLVAAGTAVVVTTGGTGFSPSDVTPEATLTVLERHAPGLAEAMRGFDPRGRLGRGVCGTVGRALVVNCPGSPGGAVDQLTAILDVLPHALRLLADTPTAH